MVVGCHVLVSKQDRDGKYCSIFFKKKLAHNGLIRMGFRIVYVTACLFHLIRFLCTNIKWVCIAMIPVANVAKN